MWQREQHARDQLNPPARRQKGEEEEGLRKISESVEAENTVVNGHLAKESKRDCMIIDEDKLFPKNLAPPPMPADTRNNFTRFLSRFSQHQPQRQRQQQYCNF